MGSSTKTVPVNSATQQQVQIPQYLQDAGVAATSKATDIANKPYQAYSGELVAPLTGTQTGAINLANNSVNAGRDSLGLAKGALGAAGGVAAGAVGSGSGALGKAAGNYSSAGALADLGSTGAVNAQGVGQDNLSAASSDATLQDILSRYNLGAGQDSLAASKLGSDQASSMASSAANAGARPINTAANSATGLVGTANATQGTGSQSGNLDALLASLGGAQAAGTTQTGKSSADLDAALAALGGSSAINNQGAGTGDLNMARDYTAKSTAPITGDQIASYFNPYIAQAIDPVAAQLTKQAGQNKANIDSKAAMSGSFGGSRTGLVEAQNQSDLTNSLSSLYGTGYKDAYDNAQTQAGDALQRYATGAGLFTNIAGQANTGANDTISRLIQASGAAGDASKVQSGQATDALGRLTSAADTAGRAGTTQSDLATAGQNRVANANTGAIAAGTAQSDQVTQALQRLISAASGQNANATTASDIATAGQNRVGSAAGTQAGLATTSSGLATDALNRLNSAGAGQISAGNAQVGLGQAQSQLSTADMDRLLALISPANATASADSGQTNDALQRLLTTGALQQTQGQNVDNANYQQYLNELNYPTQQLQALIAAAGGVPYGTSTTSATQGQQIVQSPSILGQIAGAVGAGVGAFGGSSRDAKENFAPVDDEDILAKFRNLPVETYNYKNEAGAAIGDDGRRRIGPMSQDFGREFFGDPGAKVIPMPIAIGALFSAVRALDKRTSPKHTGGALPLAA